MRHSNPCTRAKLPELFCLCLSHLLLVNRNY
jgi:hypothetical protein